MKTVFTTLIIFVFHQFGYSQGTVCNPNGNLVIVTNYDGGPLDLVVDVNIPNLIIGLVSYEALQVNLSGPFAGNVVAVHYAGVNSNNNHCNLVIPTTSITGAPASATIAIDLSPPSPVTNPNGNQNIICAYTCDTSTVQGGCNTIDQVEGYFLQEHPGSVIYSHYVQYGCYTAPMLVSGGGNCCPNPIPPISITASINPSTCIGVCNGIATINIIGGTPPFTYIWSNGNTTDSDSTLCPGIYNVTVIDSNNFMANTQFTIVQPPSVNYFPNITADDGTCNGSINILPFGGTPPFTYLWDTCSGSGSTTSSLGNLCAGTCCVTITDGAGCADTVCFVIPSTVGLQDLNEHYINIYPNPSTDGIFYLTGNSRIASENFAVIDQPGRSIPYGKTITGNVTAIRIFGGPGMYYLKNGIVVKKLFISGTSY